MNDDQQQQAAATPEPQAQAEAPAAPQASEPAQQNAAPATITGNAGAQTNAEQTNNAAAAEPIVYDLRGSIPEGWEFDQQMNDAFINIIKDTGLTNEQANAITAYGYQWADGLMQAAQTARAQEIAGWGEATKKELGGQFDSTVAQCGTAVEYLEKSNPGLREALNSTGAGNRIEIVRAFAELGRLLGSDPGKLAGAGGVKAGASARYPNTDFSRYR